VTDVERGAWLESASFFFPPRTSKLFCVAEIPKLSLSSHFSTKNLLHYQTAAACKLRTTKQARTLKVAEEKPTVPNEISDETGQYDARFVLWRKFCADNNVPVETLPSDLSGDIKDRWEKLKAERLKGDKA
jgi:hypothetical protein